ncbi:hypothetical protein EON63_19105 [archaeon]|nr:MAG: hypothetical protein EON63_19105 [archaeon]
MITIQAALLYTNSNSERRIRVHTMVVPVTQVPIVYGYRVVYGEWCMEYYARCRDFAYGVKCMSCLCSFRYVI